MDRTLQIVLSRNCALLESIATGHHYLNLEQDLLFRIDKVVKEVRDKLSLSQIRLALVGGFSSGKSTLINALMGTPVLASRITPTTICPTYIKRADKARLVIRGRWSGPKQSQMSFPGQLKLRLKQEGYPDAIMENLSDGVFAVPVKFSEPGIYDAWVMDGSSKIGEVEAPVLDCSQETWFYYNVLSGCVSYSGTYFHIPKHKIPIIKVITSDKTREFTLRSCDFSNVWSAVIDVPNDKVKVECTFDWRWFQDQGATRVRKKAKRSLWDLLKMIFNKLSDFEIVELDVSYWPRMSCWIDNTGSNIGKLRVSLDLNNGTFDYHETFSGPMSRAFTIADKDSDGVADLIGMLTATGSLRSSGTDFAGVVDELTLEHPGIRIDDSVIIIDTPGIAADSDHTAKTVSIVRNEADACLFLCPAEQAATLGDLGFVEENLMNVVGDIAFVITKADKASDAEELEEIVESVREKIKDRLGISNPHIFTVSAREALECGSAGSRQFDQFSAGVAQFAVRNRDRILAKRLAYTESLVMKHLADKIKETEREYASELAKLQKYVIENLEDFAVREARRIDEQLLSRIQSAKIYDTLVKEMLSVLSEHVRDITDHIHSVEDQAELQRFCDNVLEHRYAKIAASLNQCFMSQVSLVDNWLIQTMTEILMDFERAFEKQYPLKRIGRAPISLDRDVFSKKQFAAVKNWDERAALREARDRQDSASGWGLGAGALIGSFVLPGIGTIIGGLAGSFLGTLFGPSLDQVKSSLILTITDKTAAYFNSTICPQIDRLMETRIEEIRDAIYRVLTYYLVTYKVTVDSIIGEHEKQKKQVEHYVFAANNIVNELSYRLHELEELSLG